MLAPQDHASTWPWDRLGKYVFEFGDANEIEVGLYLEKGMSAEAASVLGWTTGILDDDWMWARFVDDVRRGTFGRVLAGSEAVGLHVEVRFDLKPVPSAGAEDVLASAREFDRAAFTLGGSAPMLVGAERTRTRTPAMKALESARTHADLADALAKIDGFTWVDAWIVATFACCDEARCAEVWPADRLWSELLARLAPWAGGA
jgi:hypothetical protein